jgi:hypothetical protein
MKKYKLYENPTNGYTEKIKEGYNWPVMLAGPCWYLYNGMIGKGLMWLLLAIVIGAFTAFIGAIVVWIIAGAKANKEKEQELLKKGWIFKGCEEAK